ncbi:MAG: biotin transporter BioY [Chloroflexota bacterium]
MQVQTRTLTLSDVVLPGTGILRNVALVVGFGRIGQITTVTIPIDWILRNVALVVGFGFLTAVLAQIAVYLSPLVPLTGQTLGVVLSGAVLGSRKGALSQMAYLGAGAMGLPVFAAGHAGLPYMMGPTAGYLVGFVAAAYVVGLLAERGWDRRVWTMAVAMVAGLLVIHLSGIAWLSMLVPFSAIVGIELPFVPGEIIKVLLAAGAFPSAWALLRKGKK